MPRQAKALSARKVETVKEPGLYADGNGLYLQVARSGAKSWIFRYTAAGKRRDMGLGGLASVSLATARQKAQDARQALLAGIDPLEARKLSSYPPTTAAGPTFREIAEECIAAHAPGWKSPKSEKQWRASLETYAYPHIGDLPVDRVDVSGVLAVLRPIWTAKPETAARVRGRVETVLGYAKAAGKRGGDNPAAWKDHLDHLLPAKSDVVKVLHFASLPYAELPGFFTRLQAQDGVSARALEFVILTACRTSGALGALWDEMDLDAGLWTIPADRMKAGALLRVPLSVPAVTLLRRRLSVRTGAYVFPGQTAGKPLSDGALLMVLRRMGLDVTPHGFRSTFRTWVAEKTTYPDGVAEAALGHTQGDKVIAAYQRGDLLDKRRALMEEWAWYCTS
ncbi:integrase [Skermanella aerolata]|uniref:tyrosine-type recombinase/integrase n=1 Tax=Skermanella aerolata TaxID=393310 RepID=UPI003D1D122A